MQVVSFTAAHVAQAAHIAKQNYEEERGFVPALPPVENLPDLMPFAQNGLGVAAVDGDTLLGFLCGTSPFQNAFRSTDATGIFSPMGANGVVGKNRANTYARLYQAAGEKWAGAGASSHAVCLYAHDKETQEQFFRYGFGLRCVDAIRGMDEIAVPSCEDIEFSELMSDEFSQILPFDHMLDAHMAASPTFILRPSETAASFVDKAIRNCCRFFVARVNGEIAAFDKIERDGETFICDTPGYLHITGAFCQPVYRGRAVYQNLLNYIIRTLKTEGYTRIGTDFESINPTAYGFWLKYFDAYTHGIVRRIDEHAVGGMHNMKL